MLKTIDSLGDLSGKKVLVRSDLNVPLDGTTITDDGRVRASVPTIQKLLDAGASVIVTAHLGRPAGAPEAKYSLAPAAARLSELLGKPALKAAAKTYRDLASQWTALAEACLPDKVQPFKQTKKLLRKRNEQAAIGGAKAQKQIDAASAELREIEDAMRKGFPLDAAKTKEMLEGLSSMVAAVHAAETEAAKMLM